MTPTIPIAKHADLSHIEALRPFVEGKHCIVVGSAPIKTPITVAGFVMIAVNGGVSNMSGPADVWVVNSKAQDALGALVKPLHKVMLEQGRGRSVGHLLLLRGPKVASEQLTLTAFAQMKCRHQSWSVFDKATKGWLEVELCDRPKRDDKAPCSSGILTVAMALYVGAESVRLAGFSFSPGYHYLQKEQPQRWWRNHVEADKRALHALTARYGTRLSGDLVQQAVAA